MTQSPAADSPVNRRVSGAIGLSPRGQLSDLLVRSGVVTADTVAQALQRQDFTGKRLGTILVESGAIDEFQLAAAIAHQAGLPVVDLVESEPSRSAVAAIDGRTARSLRAVPIRIDASILDVAVSNGRPNTREQLESATGKTVRLYVAPEVQIETLLDHIYPIAVSDSPHGGEDAIAPSPDQRPVEAPIEAPITESDPRPPDRDPDTEPAPLENATSGTSDASTEGPPSPPVLDSESGAGWKQHLCDASDPLAALLQLALATEVTTVGLDTFPAGTRLRLEYRDGRLETLTIPNEIGRLLVENAHAVIGHEPNERHRAGSGQFEPSSTHPGAVVRVDSLPTMLGHTLTLRVLRDSHELHELDDLGLPADVLEKIRGAVTSKHGLFIITGQTGSGRSTTLQAIVREALRHDKRVLLLEGNQRQLVSGASQAQLDVESPHLTIRAARSMDVDVIAIDGIYDSLSARQALEGALDGNLIFASMHARNAADAIEQLLWLASEPTTVAGAVRLVLAQTVVEARCENCRDIPRPMAAESATSSADSIRSQDGTCEICSGPAGREHVVVFEALEPTSAILQRAGSTFEGTPPLGSVAHSSDEQHEAAKRFSWRTL
jgi:MSHA biogenesis protein MshE